MSIKTFPYRPFGGNDNLLIFLVISVLLHLAFALGFISLSPLLKQIEPREKPPVVVDVVDLPPGPSSAAPPKNFRYNSDRNQSVQKETFPEPSMGATVRSIPAPIAGSKGGGKEGVKTPPKTAVAEVKQPKAQPAQKSSPAKEEAAKVPPKASVAGDESYGVKKAEKSEARPVAGPQGKGAAKPAEETPPRPQDNGQGRNAAKGAAPAKPASPDLFPTPERITELEKRYEANAPKGERGKTLQLNTSELRYQKYIMSTKPRVYFYWEYPVLALRSGWQGTLYINFTINKDGTVSDIKVLKSSGYPALDDAAVTALRLASPLPPFPDDYDIEELNIRGEFEYKISGGPQGG